MRFHLVSSIVSVSLALQPAPCQICSTNSTSTRTATRDRLEGLTLSVCGAPNSDQFFQYDAAAPPESRQCTGIDVDLMVALAGILRFNFTIVVPEHWSNESWDDW